MSKDFFKNATFSFQCPNCNKNIETKVSNVGNSIVCPFCNTNIELQDDGFSKELTNANNLLDKFGKDLSNSFK